MMLKTEHIGVSAMYIQSLVCLNSSQKESLDLFKQKQGLPFLCLENHIDIFRFVGLLFDDLNTQSQHVVKEDPPENKI